MKNYLSFLLLLLASLTATGKVDFEQVVVPSLENPVSFALSPDGLMMVIVDQPRRGNLIVKQTVRPHLQSAWSFPDEVSAINKLIDAQTRIDGLFISYDGTTLYFAANFSDSRGGLDLYSTKIADNKWTEPVNLGTPINSVADENHPSLSGNQRTFYFTREVKMKKLESFQTGEAWMSRLDPAEKWMEPEKLNTAINAGGIASLKIMDDNKTIFYSLITNDKTKWDLFWAKRFVDKHWYLPVAIDTFNTKEIESNPVFLKADGFFYFIHNEGSEAKPRSGIYRTRIPGDFIPEKTIIIKGKVWDTKNNRPIKAEIKATDPVLGDIHSVQISDEQTGSFQMLLNAGLTYMLQAQKPGYSQQYQLFSAPETDNHITHDFKLFPTTELTLNVYDKEMLRPLDAEIMLVDQNSNPVVVPVVTKSLGQKQMTLPIGVNYTAKVKKPFFLPNELSIGLSTTVLFDRFVRDIELEPVRRNIEFFVTDQESQQPIEADIVVYGLSGQKTASPQPTEGQTGLYTLALRDGHSYPIDIRGPKGYIFKHTEIDLLNDRNLKRLNIELEKLKVKVAIRLNNINFEFNSSDLMENSYEELNRVVKLMSDNPGIKIEIMAHTDDIGSDKYNDILSDKRANSVVQYLIESGIVSQRLISNGYGKRVPLVPNTSDENRALNRRVEMKIIDLDHKNEIESEQ